ncbi:hypothetical protein C4D60_Mb05t04440 [Musa balbisiana]|uniref:Uncharacterized protein n=1 Tax=Musa balbisiana TaxID=52838 RepID=A0A4S8JTN2_MUSBA|nr:hypothetical protein C4D60_Mb05t04440 [Musa balbisiana]
MQVAKEKSIASGLHNSTGYVFLSSATTKSFLICHDGGSESATSSQVHTPVEAQQQGKPSASDCQVPADGCELPLSAKMTEASHNSANLLQVKKKEGCGAMLILELGIWVIPLTLIFAPCRRLVHLVAELQRVGESMMRPRSASPAIWSRLERLNSVALII